MKKLFTLCLVLVLALGLAACGKEKESSDAQSVDLRAEYEAGIKQVQDELGDNAPVLLEETAVELLNSYYPGLENAKLKQGVFFISPTATSCEVSMYPDEAAMWKNSSTVTVNGNYVVLEVLPEGCTVPDAFLAKF